MVISFYVCAGNGIQLIWKNNKCSSLLGHLSSSLKKYFLFSYYDFWSPKFSNSLFINKVNRLLVLLCLWLLAAWVSLYLLKYKWNATTKQWAPLSTSSTFLIQKCRYWLRLIHNWFDLRVMNLEAWDSCIADLSSTYSIMVPEGKINSWRRERK